MCRFSLLTAVASSATLALSACGTGSVDEFGLLEQGAESAAIINGETCEREDFPTAVAILIDARISIPVLGEQDIKTVICTGTLIAPDTVITAAHCLDSTSLTFGFGEVLSEQYSVTFEPDLVALAGGQAEGTTVDLPEDRIDAAAYFAHEAFDLNNLENVAGPGDYSDIGVIFLSETVDTMPEIIITSEEASQLVVGMAVDIAGWGQQEPTTGGPFEAPPPGTVGRKICAVSTINELGDTEFQVGGDSTTSRKCHGDSGGPTYVTIETPLTNKQRLIGITSHAYDQEDCAKGGVDTRIDSFLPWLDDKMKTACGDGTRAWCDVDGIISPSFYETTTPTPEAETPTEPDSGTGEPEADPGLNLLPSCNSTGAPLSTSAAGGLFALFALVGLSRRRRG